jgi:hypothetical protein
MLKKAKRQINKEFKGWKTDIRCKEKRRIASKTAHFPRFKIIVICL